MHPVLFIHTQEALQLANARIAGFHDEQRNERKRLAPAPASRGGFRAALANVAAALRSVDVAPIPRLSEYPYRP
jgi:hypothetical protein